jgi:hypothetical protein
MSLEHFFIKAFHLTKEYPEQNVLTFAVKRTKSIRVEEKNWRDYETFLLKVARSTPTAIPAIVEILVNYNIEEYELGRKRIKKLIDDLIRLNAPLAHHAEVAWALFLSKELNIPLSETSAKAISKLESSICGLLALDMNSKGLISSGLDTNLWRQSMSESGLSSSMWLLAYEADLKDWLTGRPYNFVNNHAYFSCLKSKNISFYDINKTIKTFTKKEEIPPEIVSTESFLGISSSIVEDEDSYGGTHMHIVTSG